MYVCPCYKNTGLIYIYIYTYISLPHTPVCATWKRRVCLCFSSCINILFGVKCAWCNCFSLHPGKAEYGLLPMMRLKSICWDSLKKIINQWEVICKWGKRSEKDSGGPCQRDGMTIRIFQKSQYLRSCLTPSK